MNNDQSNINNDFYTSDQDKECFYNFDSFVDPNMLLPGDVSLDDFGAIESIPALPSEIPPVSAGEGKGPGSLYEKLTTTPISNGTCLASPTVSAFGMYPYGSPYSMGSPSSLMMTNASLNNDVSWMHSNRPRRRRSAYSSPSMMTMTPTPASPYLNAFTNFIPMMNPYMMAPAPMSPMNVTVKLPMVPLTPSSSQLKESSGKIPLVLPCHLQQEQQSQNTSAPNISCASLVSSGVPSRCSSIAPSTSTTSSSHQNWFTEMSATKDRFLKDVASLDLSNVTVLELKQILRRFGLNSTGKKAQLIERIMEISNYLKTEGRKRVKLDKPDAPELDDVSDSESIISNLSAANVTISAAV